MALEIQDVHEGHYSEVLELEIEQGDQAIQAEWGTITMRAVMATSL